MARCPSWRDRDFAFVHGRKTRPGALSGEGELRVDVRGVRVGGCACVVGLLFGPDLLFWSGVDEEFCESVRVAPRPSSRTAGDKAGRGKTRESGGENHNSFRQLAPRRGASCQSEVGWPQDDTNL